MQHLCYPPEKNPWQYRPNLSSIKFALILRRTKMSTEAFTQPTGFLYEFGDLLLAVIAVAIPLVALPLFLL